MHLIFAFFLSTQAMAANVSTDSIRKDLYGAATRASTMSELLAALRSRLHPIAVALIREKTGGDLNARIRIREMDNGKLKIEVGDVNSTFEFLGVNKGRSATIKINGKPIDMNFEDAPESSYDRIFQAVKSAKVTIHWSIFPVAHANPEEASNKWAQINAWTNWGLANTLFALMICEDYRIAVEECERPTGKMRSVLAHAGLRTSFILYDDAQFNYMADVASRSKIKLNCQDTHEKTMKECLQKHFRDKPDYPLTAGARSYLGIELTKPKGSGETER